MKRKLIIALGSLAFVTSAQAVAIGLEWAGNTANPNSYLSSAPMTMRLYIQNGSSSAGEAPIMQAMGVVINVWQDAACTIPLNNVWYQVSVTPLIPGWHVDPANENTDLNGLQYAAISGVGLSPNWTVPRGKTYLMDISVQWISTTLLPGNYLTINREASVIVDHTGGDYMTNDAIWYSSGFSTAGKSRWGFGNWGGGKWQRYDSSVGHYIGQAANPLVVWTPEPTSLMLLVVGACAGARRPGFCRSRAGWSTAASGPRT